MTPILDGKALLYSFVSKPEVGIGIAFGSGGSQSATELPGVSPWLVCLTESNLSTFREKLDIYNFWCHLRKVNLELLPIKIVSISYFATYAHLIFEHSLVFQVSLTSFLFEFSHVVSYDVSCNSSDLSFRLNFLLTLW